MVKGKIKKTYLLVLFLMLYLSTSISFKFPKIPDNFGDTNILSEPSLSEVFSENFIQFTDEYILNMSDYEQIRDVETFDLLNNGRDEIIVSSTIWNITGDTDHKGLLQIFDTGHHNIVLLDSLLVSNASNNAEFFEINLYDLDDDGTTEIIMTGGIVNTGWAFFKVYNFTFGYLQLEWENKWFSSYSGSLNVVNNDMIFADFDNDGTSEVCTLTTIKYDYEDNQNLIRFWTVGSKSLILENTFSWNTGTIELSWTNDDNFLYADLDADNVIEILIFGAHNTGAPSGDYARLYSLTYNGVSLNGEASITWEYSGVGTGDHGLQWGDFDNDGVKEVLAKFQWRQYPGDFINRAHYNMVNYSGSLFNEEFGDTYWFPGSDDQFPGHWFAKNLDGDPKIEFVSTDYYSNNNTAFIRIWNYSNNILLNTETKQISTDCVNQPPYLGFLANNSRMAICYQKQDSSGFKLVITVYGYSLQISINSPIQNELFGTNTPNFDISVYTKYLSTTWYTLDNGQTNYTFNGLTGTIDQNEWDKKGNGTVVIRFYANDSWGLVEFSEVKIYKDIILPEINIIEPIPNQIYGTQAPVFSIDTIEPNLQEKWYRINGGQNITFTESNGTIDQDMWDNVTEGEVTITFYAQDKVGNIGTESVTVTKRFPSKKAIIGFNIFLLIGVISVVSAILMKKQKQK